MAGYVFLRKEDGKPEDLAVVDDKICEFRGIEPDPNDFSLPYELVVTLGFAAAHRTTNGTVTQQSLDECFARAEASPRGGITESGRILAQEFLVNRYTFDTWR